MSKTIQRPLACRNAHCGAMCCPIQAEEMYRIWGGNPNKCPYYERRDDLYRKTEILDKIKQARKQIIDEKDFAYADFEQYKEEVLGVEAGELPDDDFRYGMERCLEILNKLIAESEIEE